MDRLWNYEGYVKFLSHENSLVRRWAFDALEKHYPNQYTDEISKLISDEDSHLACSAPEYLAKHNAVQHAPAILISFLNGSGNIPSNCALALSKMKYEPALETIIESLTTGISEESLFGVFNYLGSIHAEAGREALVSAVTRIKDPMLLGNAVLNLLRHGQTEDVTRILDMVLKPVQKGKAIESFLVKAVVKYWDAGDYLNDLSKNMESNNIIDDPENAIGLFFEKNDHLAIDPDVQDKINHLIRKRKFHDLSTTLLFEAQHIIKKRYPDNHPPEEAKNLFNQDSMAVVLFKELSRQPALWNKLKKSKSSGADGVGYIVCLVLSVYFSIIERNVYVKALSPDSKISDLLEAVKHSGSKLPDELYEKIVHLAPVSELKAFLSDDLNTWGDIWIVKIMGRIGKKEFVPDLIRILNNADSMDYIYSDAITSLNALEESSDELILSAARNKEIGDWEVFSILEYLPYSESFDLTMGIWNDENNDADSYELFSYCLRGIGDARGIEVLQGIYNSENNAGYIGGSLECLSVIHNVDIPELPAIKERRREDKKQQELRAKELNDIFNDTKIKNSGEVIPFQRVTKKVGRNEPCPCGSGKK